MSLVVLIGIFFLTIYSYNADEEKHDKTPSTIKQKIIRIFNPAANFTELQDTSKEDSKITALYGLRMIIVVWIIFASSFWFSITGIVSNTYSIYNFLLSPELAFIYFGYFAVDALLLISGFLAFNYIYKAFTSKKEVFLQKDKYKNK